MAMGNLVESLRKEGDNSANAIKDRFFESMRKIVGSSEVDTKAFHDKGDHVKPGFAIIPAGQSYAGFEVAVLVAFAVHCRLFLSFCAQGAQGGTPGCARRDPRVRKAEPQGAYTGAPGRA